MRRVMLYANQSPHSQMIKEQLSEKLLAKNIIIVEEECPDYLITIGGDGTLISAFHQYQQWIDVVQFIGIHTGHLGFYTDWQVHELDELVTLIAQELSGSVSYPLLEVQLLFADGSKQILCALNEFSLRTLAGTMVCDVFIKEELFETFRGDGLCIATPTGSTALSKSLGGAVMHPRLDALQLTEMASINNRVYRTLSSPIVIPKDEYFVLKPHPDGECLMMYDDNRYPIKNVTAIRLQIASKRIQFASFKHTHFWNRVEQAFIGRVK